jgi:hypothetical protein
MAERAISETATVSTGGCWLGLTTATLVPPPEEEKGRGPPGATTTAEKGTPLLAMLSGITRKRGAEFNSASYALRRATAAGSIDLGGIVVVIERIEREWYV